MASRVLVLGATGMLGHQLMKQLGDSQSYQVFGSARNAEALRPTLGAELSERVFSGIDVTDIAVVRTLLKRVQPDVVVNCVGVIKQRPGVAVAESTIRINALFPHVLAKECSEAGARMIHVSTDCVFSGRAGNYTEDDEPDAVDLYGRSKHLGEVSGEGCLTLRTSIIGHELVWHRSLIDWFLSQSGVVRGYTRAIYSGVTTNEFARALETVVLPRTDLSGLYHLASDPISKYELLRLVAKEYRWVGEIVPYDEFVCDRSLLAKALLADAGYQPPPWPEMISGMYRARFERDAGHGREKGSMTGAGGMS